MTSAKTPAPSGPVGQESSESSSTWKTPGAESSSVHAGPLGRPQNSKHSALSPSEPSESSYKWKTRGTESSSVNAGSLGRPQESKHPALSPSAQPDASSLPVFPSAPTNALGITENPDSIGKPLVIADPKAGGGSTAGDGSEALSNQDPLPIEYQKKKYPSGEHLFHAMRFMDTRPLLAEHIRECDDPKAEAERFIFEQNPGWDQMKVQKMEEVIQLKCKQHNSFKDRLRETGDTHIYF
ncbi:hypothetical protein FRC00_005866, partial [Tulasnella sp. 408]